MGTRFPQPSEMVRNTVLASLRAAGMDGAGSSLAWASPLTLHLNILTCNIRLILERDFPGGLVEKHLPAMQEMKVRGLGREDSPGEGNGNLLQYSCQGNLMDIGAWWAIIRAVSKSQTQLSD